MLKVAVTGNIASGKSAFEDILKSKGFEVLDTDAVSHNLLKDETIKTEIKNVFCDFEIFEGSEISRPKLGKIVFNDDNLRKKLEGILHPGIMDEVRRFFRRKEEQGEKIAFASVPLLFETGFEKFFDKIILVYAADDIRLERLVKRDNLSLEYAQNRLNLQISQNKKLSLADYVLYNNKDFESLRQEADKIVSLL